MPSLKEIKLRIESVKKTLKITSVMKLVAAAKLKKTQRRIANLLPYQKELEGIFKELPQQNIQERLLQKVLIICISSNSSLCGAFNNNVIKGTKDLIERYLAQGLSSQNIKLLAIGRKVGEGLAQNECEIIKSCNHLCEYPEYKEVSSLVDEVVEAYNRGEYDCIDIVYNHLANPSHQPTTFARLLPLEQDSPTSAHDIEQIAGQESDKEAKYIIEPSLEHVSEVLFPLTLRLKLYTILLDAITAEHSARMLAMQLASDNAKELVEELSLEYNKSRQQKITAEILDLLSASM